MNIVLIGFMGTGKTTVAKRIAGLTKMSYVSTDELIEEKEGMPINDIFLKRGEPHFRKIERAVVKDISDMDRVVVDAGGGVVMDPANMERLKKKGIVICLWAEPAEIYNRTRQYTHRPLLNVKDPMGKIKDLLEKRRPYYERADFHVNTGRFSIDEAADSIIRMVKKL